MAELTEQEHNLVKQTVAKLTSFGFPNDPRNAHVVLARILSTSVTVWYIQGLIPHNPVFVLVVNKGHSPQIADHVVDFRIGQDIY